MRLRRTISVLALLLLTPGVFGPGRAAAQTLEHVELAPTADNTLYERSEGDLSNGAGIFLFAGRIRLGALRRAVLHFDVANAIPAGATIVDAHLRLYHSTTVVLDRTLTLHRMTTGWGEGTSDAGSRGGAGAPSTPDDATWIHTRYDMQFWNEPGGDFVASPSARQVVEREGQFYYWTGSGLVADVQAWLDDASANHGWMLRSEEDRQSTKRFASREHPEAEWRPRLVVTYTTAPARRYTAPLSSRQILPAATTTASGTAWAAQVGTTIQVSGTFAGLTAPLAEAVVYAGRPGEQGTPLATLVTDVAPNGQSGSFVGTANAVSLPADTGVRALYVALHSADGTRTELRGAFVPSEAIPYFAVLHGTSASPPTDTGIRGQVLLDLLGDQLSLSGTVRTPTGNLRIQLGTSSLPLTLTPLGESLAALEPGDNTFVLDAAQRTALASGRAFLETDEPARGYVLPADRPVFIAQPAEANGRYAWFSGVLVDTTLVLRGRAMAASGGIAEVTLRQGPVGTAHEVLTVLTASTVWNAADDRVPLGPEAREALANGQLALTVRFSDDVLLTGHLHPQGNEAPASPLLLAPPARYTYTADGVGELALTWTEATDPNGHPVAYRWQLAGSAEFSSLLLDLSVGADTTLVISDTALTTAVAAAGMGPTPTLFHRVLATDGSLSSAGTPQRLDLIPSDAPLLTEPAVSSVAPQPSAGHATLYLDLPMDADVTVAVYDVLGRRVARFAPRSLRAGLARALPLDLHHLADGLYLARITFTSAQTSTLRTHAILLTR